MDSINHRQDSFTLFIRVGDAESVLRTFVLFPTAAEHGCKPSADGRDLLGVDDGVEEAVAEDEDSGVEH